MRNETERRRLCVHIIWNKNLNWNSTISLNTDKWFAYNSCHIAVKIRPPPFHNVVKRQRSDFADMNADYRWQRAIVRAARICESWLGNDGSSRESGSRMIGEGWFCMKMAQSCVPQALNLVGLASSQITFFSLFSLFPLLAMPFR